MAKSKVMEAIKRILTADTYARKREEAGDREPRQPSTEKRE